MDRQRVRVQPGHPAGDLAGDVLRGQADVGEDLGAGAVRMPRLGYAQVAYGHLHVAVTQRLAEGGADAAGTYAVLQRHHQPVVGREVPGRWTASG